MIFDIIFIFNWVSFSSLIINMHKHTVFKVLPTLSKEWHRYFAQYSVAVSCNRLFQYWISRGKYVGSWFGVRTVSGTDYSFSVYDTGAGQIQEVCRLSYYFPIYSYEMKRKYLNGILLSWNKTGNVGLKTKRCWAIGIVETIASCVWHLSSSALWMQ